MKGYGLFGFALLIVATPIEHVQKRQLVPLSALLGKTQDFTILKKLTPEIDSTATRELLLYGPYKILAKNATHAGLSLFNGIKLDPNSDTMTSMIKPPCTDCTVLKALASLAYKNGTIADVSNGVYTHHIIISQYGRQQLPNPVKSINCTGRPSFTLSGMTNPGKSLSSGAMPAGHAHSRRQNSLGSLVPAILVGGGGSGGSGAAFAVKNSNVKTGAYISTTDGLQFFSEAVNYDNFDKDIYFVFDVEYVPKKAENLLNVGMGGFGLNCATYALDPPKDKPITFEGTSLDVTADGYFVSFTPHLHDGGTSMKLYVNDKMVCESKALYTEDSSFGATTVGNKKWETITGYSACDKLIPFKKGDKVRTSAEYDLTKHTLRPDSHEMGEAEAMAIATYIWAKAL